MRFRKPFQIIMCMALISMFAFTPDVYAQNAQKHEFGAITASKGIFHDQDYSSDDPADGLKDLFTALTGYSEKDRSNGPEEIRTTILYTFPPLVWAKTILARAIDHPKFTFTKDLPLSRRLFLNSLFVSANVRASSLLGQKLWKDLCADDAFTDAVKEAIKGKDKATFVFRSERTDLLYSVAHITVKCRRMSSTEEGEKILVECSDYYNFAPTDQVGYLNDLGEIINEIGWQGYRLRILVPYSIYAMGELIIR